GRPCVLVAPDRRRQVVPPPDVQVAGTPEKRVAGQQRVNAAPKRPGGMVILTASEIRGPADEIIGRGDAAGMERLDFARNEQRRPMGIRKSVIERFDAEPITSREQRLLLVVPDQQRKHSNKPTQAGGAPLLVRREDDLAVGSAPERIIAERFAQLEVVID